MFAIFDSRRFVKAALLTQLLLLGCGRTPPPLDPCADGRCPCVFDTDCPSEHTCIDNVCLRLEDYLDCLARGAEPETCNGRDDDCDGLTDEGLGEAACERGANAQTCPGTEVCGGAAGWVCDAPVPSAELCDGVDNDCDGVIDGPFVNDAGLYAGKENCGSCGSNCDVLIPDASETECALEPQGPHCRVLSCPPGTYVDETRSTCLLLPDGLCQPCTEDSQCLGPNPRCLDLGNDERACGRDCGPDSAWGTACPGGYVCVDTQCQPTSGTCLCTQPNVGVTRSCVIDTCDGFETCEPVGPNFDWSTCDISAHRETCDGLDNDCDGAIDNGFLNPATGRYESDLHCSVCNNDCTRRWAPEVDHAIGGCDLSSGRPECRILSCTTETIGGQAFEWVNVDGLPDNGCECRRRQGNTSVDAPDLGTFAQLSAGVIDENCDGIDGVISDAIFVSRAAAPGGDGSLARPFTRIADGLNAWLVSPRIYILVAEGVYRERIELFEGVQLYGGYSDDFLRRDVLQLATILQSPVTPGQGPEGTVRAANLGQGPTRTVFAGFYVYGADATGAATAGQPGPSSVGLVLDNTGAGLTVQNNVIRGGRGGEGGRGTTGDSGFGRQDSTQLDGSSGINGERVNGPCNNLSVSGGSGGVNPSCGAASARPGGGSTCPTFNLSTTPTQGGQAAPISPIGNDGPGGFHWSFDQLSGQGCSHVTESGFPSNIQSNNGTDGGDGDDGVVGADGLGCAAPFGSLLNGAWAASSAQGGRPGGAGQAGGGGGAGGGTARFSQGPQTCQAHEVGATGGGGGAGGCGGTGAAPGGTGGASIAVLMTGSGAGPTLRDNRIERGLGGRGGDGGFGGSGGRGGRGGFPGGTTSWSGSTAGKGGEGGNGGDGGSGGGGCGGASYGVLAFGVPGASAQANNTFSVPQASTTGGPAGAGGNGTPSGGGDNGASSNVLSLVACGAGGSCPAGTGCDVNQVCIPSGP